MPKCKDITEVQATKRGEEKFGESQLIKKSETNLTGDIKEKIISMYAKGMTINDISAHIEDISA